MYVFQAHESATIEFDMGVHCRVLFSPLDRHDWFDQTLFARITRSFTAFTHQIRFFALHGRNATVYLSDDAMRRLEWI